MSEPPRTPLLLAATAAAIAVFATPSSARADWSDSRVPEGDTAFTVPSGGVRLSLLGRSAVGLSDRVELSTYLPLYFILLPNLSLKWRIADGDSFATALDGTVVAGAFPVAFGAALLPYVVVGGAGLVAGSYQRLGITESYRPSDAVALSLTASFIAMEIGGIGVGAVAGGAGAAATPVSAGGSDSGGHGSAQVDVVLSSRDLLSASAEAWWFRKSSFGLAVATATWTHAWRHTHLTVGAYSIADLPDARTLAHSKLPVGPYANVYWTF